MKVILRLMIKGLATLLPLGITIYFLYWLVVQTEKIIKPALLWVLPETLYFPGLGIFIALVSLPVVGLLVNAYFIRHLLEWGEKLLQHIPLVKSVYGALQDMVKVFNLTEKKSQNKVVSIDMGNNTQLIGFVTGEKAGKRLFEDQSGQEDIVGVYLPMSYQVGGFTVYVEKSRLKPINIGMEEAMRIAITGGTQSRTEEQDKNKEKNSSGDD